MNKHYSAMAAAFPQFDQSTLPAIPPEWVDTSWPGRDFMHACSQFGATPNALAGTGVYVVINDRDMCGCGDAYIAVLFGLGEGEILAETGADDWPSILAAVKAYNEQFAALAAMQE